MKRLATLLSILLMLTVIGIAPVAAAPSAQAGQCESGLYKTDTSDGAKVFPAGWTVCLKAGNGNTGKIITDGATTIAQYIEQSGLLNDGGQVPNISNFVVYNEEKPPSGPEWFIKTGKHDQWARRTNPNVNARGIGPAGDPFYRVIVGVGRSKVQYGFCLGWVKFPNQDFGDGYWLVIKDADGKRIGLVFKGAALDLHRGSYTGEWERMSDGKVRDEIERFDITCNRAVVPAATDVKVTWRYVGRDGVRKVTQTIPEGCSWRSAWHFVKGDTRQWLQQKQPVNKRLATWRTASPGYYGTPWTGYTKGITCRG